MSTIDLTADELLAANMDALGLALNHQGNTDERVWRASREFIAEHKRIPNAVELSGPLGLSPSRVRQACSEMARAVPPRMLCVRGVNGQNAYIPKVV